MRQLTTLAAIARCAALAAVAALALSPAGAWARSAGNGSPETLGATSCDTGLCHGPMNAGVAVAIEGPATLLPGETQDYVVSISGAISTQKGAGLNVALFGGGNLGLVDPNTRFFGATGEITHITGSNFFEPPGGSVGDFSYNFSVTAPEEVGAMLTLNAAMNAFNFNFTNDDNGIGDRWNIASLTIEVASDADGDGDGVPDGQDNCVEVPNPGQEDVDAGEDDDSSLAGVQHYGDACDADLDNDGIVGATDFFGVFRPCLGMDPLVVPACARADLDGDGVIGATDFFGVLRPALGSAPGPGVTE